MTIYRKYILPRLLHLSMRSRAVTPLRQEMVPEARGRVLEIGIGSGLNLRFYGPKVEEVVGLDPSEELLAMAGRQVRGVRCPVRLLRGSAEAIPFADHSFDTVLTTWTLCSIPDAAKALREMRRVLRPDGRLLFVEHGRSPEEGIARWQHRLTPLWRRCAGGCHLDRPIEVLIRDAGFALTDLQTGYLVKGPRILTHHFKGRAAPARDRVLPFSELCALETARDNGAMTQHYTVGMVVDGNAKAVTVEAEDALIAALKVKHEYPAAAITYARKTNRRGDRRHPHLDITAGVA